MRRRLAQALLRVANRLDPPQPITVTLTTERAQQMFEKFWREQGAAMAAEAAAKINHKRQGLA